MSTATATPAKTVAPVAPAPVDFSAIDTERASARLSLASQGVQKIIARGASAMGRARLLYRGADSLRPSDVVARQSKDGKVTALSFGRQVVAKEDMERVLSPGDGAAITALAALELALSSVGLTPAELVQALA